MIPQKFSRDGFVSLHEPPAGESGNVARGLLFGFALSQIFWITIAALLLH